LIRQYYESFLTNENAHVQHLSKIRLNINLLIHWIENTLSNNRKFASLIEGWHSLFRTSLDDLIVNPDNVNYVDIESTIMGGKLIEFVEKWKEKSQSEQRIREEFVFVVEDNNKFVVEEVGMAPPLTQRFQYLHVMAIKGLANEDKMGKKKVGSMNLWQYINGMFEEKVKNK
jgi:hypothetical protein